MNIKIEPSLKYVRESNKIHQLLKMSKPINFERNESMDKKQNLWLDNNIPTIELDTLTNVNVVDSCMFIYNNRKEVSYEDLEKIKNAVNLVKDKYTVRLTGGTDDKVFNTLTATTFNNEIYLPFKSFNKNIPNAKSTAPSKEAFSVVKGMFKNYNSLPGFARSSNARDVEMIFGKELKERVKLILIFSDCGSEAINKSVNFITLGSVALTLRIASKLKIPLINVKNDDAINKIKQFIGSTLVVQEDHEIDF